MKRDLSKIRRVVIKVGTNTLTKGHKLDYDYIENLAGQISFVKKKGARPILVSSGAIGSGALELGIERSISKIKLRQACAAVGQPKLLHAYRLAFQQYGISIAQVLVTKETMDHRETYINLRNAVETLLDLNVLPIFNENDCISTAEIGSLFGDNDQLSAHIAAGLDAELLIILSDIDALYDQDPRYCKSAKPIHVVADLTSDILAAAGGAGSTFSSGGMQTKIKAVAIARKAGCQTILAHGRTQRVLTRILDGEDIGTLFLADKKLRNKLRWILFSTPRGIIHADAGATQALYERKNLLPTGVISIEGEFSAGDVIMINDKFKAMAGSNSSEMRKLIAGCPREIKNSIDTSCRRNVIARSANIVRIDT